MHVPEAAQGGTYSLCAVCLRPSPPYHSLLILCWFSGSPIFSPHRALPCLLLSSSRKRWPPSKVPSCHSVPSPWPNSPTMMASTAPVISSPMSRPDLSLEFHTWIHLSPGIYQEPGCHGLKPKPSQTELTIYPLPHPRPLPALCVLQLRWGKHSTPSTETLTVTTAFSLFSPKSFHLLPRISSTHSFPFPQPFLDFSA